MFSVKGGRFITHMKKLRDVDTPLANFFASGVLALGEKLGRCSGSCRRTSASTRTGSAAFFDAAAAHDDGGGRAGRHARRASRRRAWTTTDADRPLRHALEVRHASFDDAGVPRAAARARRRAGRDADTAGKWPLLEERPPTSSYVRLHGAEELYVSGYADEALDAWAAKVRAWRDDGRDVFVYFDNDVKVRAPFDAMALMGRLGLEPEERSADSAAAKVGPCAST